jgi:hypothetical protein
MPLMSTMAANLPSTLLPYNNVETCVLSLWTRTEVSEASALAALLDGDERGPRHLETFRSRRGVICGSAATGVDES